MARTQSPEVKQALIDATQKAVDLGVDQPIEGLRIKPRPMRQGVGDASGKPVLIDHRLGVAIQHPGDDL